MKRAAAPAAACALVLALGACASDDRAPSGPAPEDPPPAGDPPPPRVLVLNTLSETISVLDLETRALTPNAAIAGAWPNRLVVLEDRGEIGIVASGDNEIQFVDRTTLAVRGAADVGAGSNPWGAARSGAHLLATNWLSGELVEIDAAARSTTRRISTSAGGPEGVLVDGVFALVACSNYDGPSGAYLEGRIDLVDLASWTLAGWIPVPRNPQEVKRAPDGRVHVVCTGTYGAGGTPEEGSVAVVNAASRAVEETVAIGGSPGRVAFGAGEIAWVVGYYGGIRRYDARSLAILPPPPDPELAATGFSSVAWDSAGGAIYVTSFEMDLLVEIDEAAGTIRDAWVVGDGPIDVVVDRPMTLDR